MKKIILFILCGILFSHDTSAQVSHSTLDEFEDAGKNWVLASDMIIAPNKRAEVRKGEGILVNVPMKGATDLVSKLNLEGDFELDFDFMMSKGSKSAIYLLGRYKILLSDSWPISPDPLSDVGLVHVHSVEKSSSFHTWQPLSNVGKAPGLWQHLKVKFRAPVVDKTGQKTQKAILEEVYLNGVLIHQGLAFEGPSDGARFQDEKAEGPLVFQGDEQHHIGLRDIRYQSLPPKRPEEGNKMTTVSPILINPGMDPYLVRSYLMFEGNKRTHVISVGNPSQTNFSYDLKQGSILQFWRGNFVDATEMWESRGEPQLVKPLGAVITLSSAPSLAVLNNPDAIWPDSIPFDDLHNKGYSLDKTNSPTFHYEYAGSSVDDKIMETENGEGLKREIKVSGAPENLYFRIVKGKVIETLGKGLYAIDGKSYYIKIDERLKPILRKSQGKEELVLAFDKKQSALDYSIIW